MCMQRYALKPGIENLLAGGAEIITIFGPLSGIFGASGVVECKKYTFLACFCLKIVKYTFELLSIQIFIRTFACVFFIVLD